MQKTFSLCHTQMEDFSILQFQNGKMIELLSKHVTHRPKPHPQQGITYMFLVIWIASNFCVSKAFLS
eukprot:m.99798 g.99798  ORF g.99798 m.99798 type:complete len:67 (+) comp13683_c0_seq9:302-502(+)